MKYSQLASAKTSNPYQGRTRVTGSRKHKKGTKPSTYTPNQAKEGKPKRQSVASITKSAMRGSESWRQLPSRGEEKRKSLSPTQERVQGVKARGVMARQVRAQEKELAQKKTQTTKTTQQKPQTISRETKRPTSPVKKTTTWNDVLKRYGVTKKSNATVTPKKAMDITNIFR